ncbi:hypothetical protein BZG36_00588 [Bifiguratus adelaidae]|uniref:Glucose-6-phosphate 1-dehydrogenase n=1 Tax=Bifiguratus adelaidae TaxID=1938954 RepID=A0A261Y7B3_9FUNG|nr:hypothetical protein BZG36_00588 [Bifiguratus adelaidae]
MSQSSEYAHVTFVVMGASGDLAKKKTFPCLYRNFCHGDFPNGQVSILGFARSKLSTEDLHKKMKETIKEPQDPSEKQKYDEFFKLVEYVRAENGYDHPESYATLEKEMSKREENIGDAKGKECLRVLYVALPPSSFEDAAKNIKQACWNTEKVNRVIIEKPFGRDTKSARELAKTLTGLYNKADLFLVDHYLGKEIAKQILAFRFGESSTALGGMFSRNSVEYVAVQFKETFGAEGRGGYFDQFGIVRDVMENHLMEFICFATMEQPTALTPEGLSEARINLLKSVATIKPEDVVVGQYGAGKGDKKAYREDETVQDDSKASTFAAAVLYINNDRWSDVPFYLMAGKALDEDRVELTLHFKDNQKSLFSLPEAHVKFFAKDLKLPHNSLTFRDKPAEEVVLATSTKQHGGYAFELAPTELKLDLKSTRSGDKDKDYDPQSYEFLFKAAMENDQTWFVDMKEAEVQWHVWEDVVTQVEQVVEPVMYEYGSKGPKEADDLLAKHVQRRRQGSTAPPTTLEGTETEAATPQDVTPLPITQTSPAIPFAYAFITSFAPHLATLQAIPYFEPSQLENDIQDPPTVYEDTILAAIQAAFLNNILNRKKMLEPKAHLQQLADLIDTKIKTFEYIYENPLKGSGTNLEETYRNTSPEIKLEILYCLVDWQLSDSTAVRDVVEQHWTKSRATSNSKSTRNKRKRDEKGEGFLMGWLGKEVIDAGASQLKVRSIGQDQQRRIYWWFGESPRVWRQILPTQKRAERWEPVTSNIDELRTYVENLPPKPPPSVRPLHTALVNRVLPQVEQAIQKREQKEKAAQRMLSMHAGSEILDRRTRGASRKYKFGGESDDDYLYDYDDMIEVSQPSRKKDGAKGSPASNGFATEEKEAMDDEALDPDVDVDEFSDPADDDDEDYDVVEDEKMESADDDEDLDDDDFDEDDFEGTGAPKEAKHTGTIRPMSVATDKTGEGGIRGWKPSGYEEYLKEHESRAAWLKTFVFKPDAKSASARPPTEPADVNQMCTEHRL